MKSERLFFLTAALLAASVKVDTTTSRAVLFARATFSLQVSRNPSFYVNRFGEQKVPPPVPSS